MREHHIQFKALFRPIHCQTASKIDPPDDGKGLEKEFVDTIAVDDLIPETTE